MECEKKDLNQRNQRVGREKKRKRERKRERERERHSRDLSGSGLVKTLPSNAEGASSIPGHGGKIPHTSKPKTNKQTKNKKTPQKQYCNRFNKDFKDGTKKKS